MTVTRELDCTEIVELVTDYLDGALDVTTAAALEDHLARCPGCARYVEQFRETIATLGAISSASLSTKTQADLLEAFRTFHRPPQ